MFPVTLSQPWGIVQRGSVWKLRLYPHPEGPNRIIPGRVLFPIRMLILGGGGAKRDEKQSTVHVGPRCRLWLPDGLCPPRLHGSSL